MFTPSLVMQEEMSGWGTKGDGLYKATPINAQNSQYVLKQFKADKNNPKSISGNQIYSILEDAKGRIWVGTYDNGINLLQENQGEISFIPPIQKLSS